ncbi:MAG: hypothetical protein AB7K52_03545 [Phycisphaerales bacterium]
MTPPEPSRRYDQPSRLIGDSACILWHPPGAPPPRELVESLTKHGANIQPCDDPFSAMALACRRISRRQGAGDLSSGNPSLPSPPKAVLLLLVEPDDLPRPGPAVFVRTIQKYAPRSACWWYSRAFSPPFRAVTSQDLTRWESRDAARTAAVAPAGFTVRGAGQAAPALRLVQDPTPTPAPPTTSPGDGATPQDSATTAQVEFKPDVSMTTVRKEPRFDAAAPEAPPASALSADELSMLLGMQDPTAAPPARPGPNHERRNAP